ncbi:DUF4268 domain-containing protein [Acinetobacter towneri]|uniref:DUF4268 domain-containing protein n=1 Tax=Acinetobacter towneri TaxID=202956 RepID=UPI001CE1325B|nr:DUF4268 domain-containing protein [Acinetobacter towneri]MCA4780321.1 DUF4268 domain-containing protein [Acinetobacter towneri]MCA4785713.1 DUF4268 domain-containing protein [Acinetobacter towneri]MCA4786956.1 DUF4268 domain-containing protein [Acinetobacter towneri]MCA4796846.1 DUF4268 domain-containing protein [Acinetobacter towneri]MCA4801893.1 DUF4268 domain-containing protein [Acinetobacter towneri]
MSLYTVDTANKKLKPLDITQLKHHNLTERYDLQEWLVSHPEALGEELLIIQKEFDGFDGTGERLDLLALDTKGQLVLIENKRDDSGRDAVWQALKYASYVAPFTSEDIVNVYANYLSKYKPIDADLDADAYEPEHVHHTARILIEKFLGGNADLDWMSQLNPKATQRIILVAGEFRKEVTNTALWLIEREIDVKCVKVSPYILNDQLLVDIQQIIPVPEASEYMVRLSRKDAEIKVIKERENSLGQLRIAYWTQLLEDFQNRSFDLFRNVNPVSVGWRSAGSTIAKCNYNLIFAQKELRVEFEFATSSTEHNKKLFDFFYARKAEIEQSCGLQLDWRRSDDQKLSKIVVANAVEGYNKARWPEYIQWHFENVQKFELVFKPYMKDAYQVIK